MTTAEGTRTTMSKCHNEKCPVVCALDALHSGLDRMDVRVQSDFIILARIPHFPTRQKLMRSTYRVP